MEQVAEKGKLNVVAQKANPEATISKTRDGRVFQTTVINVMEDGTEQLYRIVDDKKRDLVKTLAKLPIANVRGMWSENGRTLLELFKYNGV